MRKYIIFCFVLFSFLISNIRSNAQQEFGQIVINTGVGYSPEFDGDFFQLYPIKTNKDFFQNTGFSFHASSIMPNLGGMIDFGISKKISIGIASSYQSETVNWSTEYLGPFSDKITRTNFALRLFYHFQMNSHFDLYAGIRVGASYWTDISHSNNNIQVGNMASGFPVYGQFTFLSDNNINSIVPSFQVLWGVRYYPFKNIGFLAELGMGSPYLAEGGVTFRINTRKEKPTNDAGIKAKTN